MSSTMSASSAAAPLPPSHDQAILDRYLAEVDRAFGQAQARVRSAPDVVYELAGYQVRLRFAGEMLARVVTPALSHLPAASFVRGLEILCWDGAATGAALPPPPWPWPAVWPSCGYLSPFGSPHVRVTMSPDTGTIMVFRTDTNQAVFWTPDASRLPTHYHGAPLLTLFAWWTQRHGLHLVHAGCVGTEAGALLLVGRGGSGKSTTSLLCAEAGLNYLSDDYCLVRPAPAPTAFALFSSGKLHRAHLATFPRLATLAVDPGPEPMEKPVIFLAREKHFAVVPQQPLRAIVAPVITGRPATSFEPTDVPSALRALAPSSLMQLPNAGAESFRTLAQLARNLPCFRLNLGTERPAIAPAIRELLGRLT
jgi:hypothetical protein